MPFLAINGVELPVRLESCEETTDEIGQTQRSFDGSLVKTRQAVKRTLAFDLTPQVQATAYAWESLIKGLGEHWSFDSNLYSAKGRTTSTLTGIAVTGTYKKHGAGGLDVSYSNVFTVPSVYSNNYSALLFKYDSGAWNHYGISFSGSQTVYRNGSSYGSSISSWFAASGGTITLTGPDYFDDLVLLPFALPVTWLAALYTWHNSNPWSDLPRLTLTGDALPEASSRTVLGEVTKADVVGAVVGGSYVTNARALSVELQQT